MSFASDAKTELCKELPQNFCCLKAECYGLFLFGKSFSKTAVSFTTEHPGTAHTAAQLSAQTAGVITDVQSAVVHRREARSAFTVTVPDSSERAVLLRYFGHSGEEVSLRIHPENFQDDSCMAAFLCGVFLSCGTITDPKKEYHLEFAVPYHNLAKDLCSILESTAELQLQPGLVNRRGTFVVYIKGSEHVADLLTYMGAPMAAMELMQVKMLKELRNNVNRKTNFETANLDKTASAAARQLLALQKIQESAGGIRELPEELQELAQLRLENPEMSLRELGQLLTEPLSRSGVNHRLQRIIAFADQLPG